MSVPAWQLLAGLPAWQVTQIPRPGPAGGDPAGGTGPRRTPAGGREQRMLSLAAAARSGSAAAFGWARGTASGPVTVIAAGQGLCADDGTAPGDGPAGPVPLSYPAGALGRPLPPGGLAAAFTALPCWLPVAITPDALLADDGDGPGARGLSPEDGLLRAWRKPFGWLVLAAPVTRDHREELLSEASLAQLTADRNDSPRAKQTAVRSRARHDELRQSATTGLWDIWLLAGAATPSGAARVAGLLCASLDLRGLPFGLTEQDNRGTLPDLLGAPPQAVPAAGPGPLARDLIEMYHDTASASRPAMHGDSHPGPGTRYDTRPGYGPGAYSPGQPGPAQDSAAKPPYVPGETDSNGFPGWAPAPAPGWAPAGHQAAWTSPLPPSAGGGSGLVPDFPDPEPQFPCAASSRLLAALAVPPAREIPGIRMILEPDFDVTPETGDDGSILSSNTPGPDAVALGTVLDASRLPAGPLAIPRSSLNRHTFVCGATGAGKSQTVRHLLESATGAGIPWLVIEPAKAEYRLMAARLPGAEVITIRPGDLAAVPAGINPLEPAAGPGGERFPLQAHADLVRALFLAAFQADEPFPQVLAAALTRCYGEAGWDMVTGAPTVDGAAYPSLGALQAAALAVVEDIGYSREITDNVRGFVSVRIGSLTGGTTGRFLDGGFPLDYGRLLSGNVILEIEDCGDDTDKAFLTGAVLIRLTEHLRMRARAEGPHPQGLRHLTVVEEAHRLLRQPPPGEGGGPAAHAVEMFAGLLAEIRAYGEGLVIAEQIPSKLIPDVIKNTAVKIVHRLPAKDDREAVGATMNLTPAQSAFLVTLRPGEAAVFTDGMDYPVLARMPDGTRREETTPARPRTADALVTGLSTACPAGCAASPCTLGRIAAARRALDGDRAVAIWAELTIAAHLAGWPSPAPGDTIRGRLTAMEPRLRDCLLARAADDAVTIRIPAFSARVAAPALAAHAAWSMRAILDHDRVPCDGDEAQWLAPVRTSNETEDGELPDEGPLRDTPPLRDAVLGTRSPSLIEKTAKTWAHDLDFAGRLARALAGFPDGDSYAGMIADAATEQG
jgi:hypothetical protein